MARSEMEVCWCVLVCAGVPVGLLRLCNSVACLYALVQVGEERVHGGAG
jgi:hypothetical protein